MCVRNTENTTQPYIFASDDDLDGYFFHDVPLPESNTPPFPYGRDWPGADAWLDPATRTIHMRP
jgi:hypothetical protein